MQIFCEELRCGDKNVVVRNSCRKPTNSSKKIMKMTKRKPFAEFIRIDTESIFDQKPNSGRLTRTV